MPEEIIRIASRGEGVTANGLYFPLAAPGDLVDEDYETIVSRGAGYAEPVCRHFPKCGGCQLQHVADGAYQDFLTDRIVTALHTQRLDVPEILSAHLSPPHARRRASMRALKMGKRIVMGFNEGSSTNIVDLKECPVLHPTLAGAIASLRTYLSTMMTSKKPVSIQMTMVDQGADIMLKGLTIEGLAAQEATTDFARSLNLARLAIEEDYGVISYWEPEPVTVTLSGFRVSFPPGAFLQATQDGEQALVAAVREAVGDAKHVADMFTGLGTFAFAMKAKVSAYEGSRDLILAMKSASDRAATLFTTEHRDLFRRPLMGKELDVFDAVVIDPPRAGAKEQMEELAKSKVPVIVSVSCNPATFARDARILVEGGYTLEWIKPVGQFRWSTHAELVALLRK